MALSAKEKLEKLLEFVNKEEKSSDRTFCKSYGRGKYNGYADS